MNNLEKSDFPIIFLGLADFVKPDKYLFPIGNIDIFQLSKRKRLVVYPFPVNYVWIFLFNKKIFKPGAEKPEILIYDEKRNRLATATWSFSGPIHKKPVLYEDEMASNLLIGKYDNWIVEYCRFVDIIPSPGNYYIFSRYSNNEDVIGLVEFVYQQCPPLTPEIIKALESDPYSAQFIKMELNCEKCGNEFSIYSSIKRFPQLEKEGCIWQYDLAESIICECGGISYDMKYYKESLHGLLDRDIQEVSRRQHYVRRYAHSEIKRIVRGLTELLDKHDDEMTFQKFIENNKVLLARFHARKLYIKPDVLGKFQADFAIFDTRKQLLFIEMEKPGIKLFKKDGHPTADLMHAYGQVRDWVREYEKHPGAVLECFKLKPDEVMAVKGVIIAGRSTNEQQEHMQRHLSRPPYTEVEFLTFDDLAKSLLQISRDLA
jgi:hypothetical protein